MFNIFVMAFIGSTFFGISVILIHFMRRDLQFPKYALSRYAVGERGRLLSLGLYSIGIAQILLAVGLIMSNTMSLGHVLLIVAGIGALIVASFKIEFPKKTLKGYLHDLGAGIQFSFFPASLLLLSPHFSGNNLYYITIVVGCVNLLLLLAISFIYFGKMTHEVEYFGLIQKTNIALMTAWVILTSFIFM